MLNIERFVVNMVEENCYVVSDETHEAVIIDCGVLYPEEAEAVQGYVAREGLKPVRLVQTHCHFDHIFGAGFVCKTWDLQPEMHRNEVKLYRALPKQLEMFLGQEIPLIQPPAGRIFEWGDALTFGSHTLTALPSPGHTPGGTCLYCEDERILFSGDSLFAGAIGRTDFPGGDMNLLINSLKNNILTLPDDVIVMPGHGSKTTIRQEKEHNPYLQ